MSNAEIKKLLSAQRAPERFRIFILSTDGIYTDYNANRTESRGVVEALVNQRMALVVRIVGNRPADGDR